jgi:hypothetical protein
MDIWVKDGEFQSLTSFCRTVAASQLKETIFLIPSTCFKIYSAVSYKSGSKGIIPSCKRQGAHYASYMTYSRAFYDKIGY